MPRGGEGRADGEGARATAPRLPAEHRRADAQPNSVAQPDSTQVPDGQPDSDVCEFNVRGTHAEPDRVPGSEPEDNTEAVHSANL